MASRTRLTLEEKHYDPLKVEKGIYEYWREKEVFQAGKKKDSNRPAYCIVIPPPNVTGRLHMGHALNNTIQDLLIRYKRMDGYDALWVPGTDHAGIATQSVVKKQLQAQGINHRELGREQFLEKVWEWKEQYGDTILMQLRRLGCSCDWSRTAFTMSDTLSGAVRAAFKRLYDEGLIYRGKYIVNWCPVDKTALSDDEVITKDGGEPGHLWYFRYPLAEGSGHLTVATTRPETMLGDTAVAVNPADERFAKYIGKMIRLPLVDREIPVIADDYVDPAFGTGCVKITPAHDPNDFQMGLRHNLAMIDVMHDDARMNDEVPEQFRGLDRYECRRKVVEAIDELGLLEKVEERMTPVGRSYRSKEVIEYRLSDQWFIKMKPLAEQALKRSENGELEYFPSRWDAFYRSWLENTRDWCISRQLWWGHRIPAWYHKVSGEILVDTEIPDRVRKNPKDWYQEDDVLDTWFSSALWPYSTLGWPEETEDLKRFFPTDVLVTGKDIIFFWVARMVMTSLFNLGKVPFRHVLINSIICDEQGETMSKSRGNGIDPLHVIDGATKEDLTGPVYEARPHNIEELVARIEKNFPDGFPGVGADALRYTMLTNATDAQQVQISLKRFDEVGRPLTNKIWNAGKLIISMVKDASPATAGAPALEDRWILSRYAETIKKVRSNFDSYSFHHALSSLYHFFWDDICDWYLEVTKSRLKSGNAEDVRRVQETLSEVFGGFLRLLHPVMPFITEEMWGHLQPLLSKSGYGGSEAASWRDEEVLALATFPLETDLHDGEIEKTFRSVQELVRAVRNMRASAGVSPSVALASQILPENGTAGSRYLQNERLICRMANLSVLSFVESAPDGMSVSVLPDARVFLNLVEHMDIEAELKRNQKNLEKLEQQIRSLDARLSNENFTARAPEQVVKAEREKLGEYREQHQKMLKAMKELESYRN